MNFPFSRKKVDFSEDLHLSRWWHIIKMLIWSWNVQDSEMTWKRSSKKLFVVYKVNCEKKGPWKYEVNKSVSTSTYLLILFWVVYLTKVGKRAILAFNDYVCIDETFRVYAQYIFFTAKEPIVIMVTL